MPGSVNPDPGSQEFVMFPMSDNHVTRVLNNAASLYDQHPLTREQLFGLDRESPEGEWDELQLRKVRQALPNDKVREHIGNAFIDAGLPAIAVKIEDESPIGNHWNIDDEKFQTPEGDSYPVVPGRSHFTSLSIQRSIPGRCQDSLRHTGYQLCNKDS